MTQEQMEHAMEFILNQQASMSVKLDMMIEQQAKDQKRLAWLEKRANNAIRLGSRFITGLGKATKELTEAQKELTGTQKKHEENLARIEENMARLEENLNAVIILFERHITETHGTI
ncbi:MAG TPA: hypothetical protein VFZ34_04370 [Blastocatellia bacterium]|nr:hypothetical protein [Blastocatellia bacterium]